MRLSEHYPAFAHKTLLVLTNNELAKLYAGEERDIEELDVITTPEPDDSDSRGTITNDEDAQKAHRLSELYHALSLKLHELALQGFSDIILCVPEANKQEITNALHPDIAKRIVSLVPKNLASMELTHVIRILFEA